MGLSSDCGTTRLTGLVLVSDVPVLAPAEWSEIRQRCTCTLIGTPVGYDGTYGCDRCLS